VSPHHFTPHEVERLIPRLTEIMGRARDSHREATTIQRSLREEQERIRVAGGGLIDRRQWKASADRLDALATAVKGALEGILALGGVAKDLDLGLVDFPGLVGGETVNLCWQYGEPAVRFWHGLDEGYAQRKPLP
jgi:hypothetical protein